MSVFTLVGNPKQIDKIKVWAEPLRQLKELTIQDSFKLIPGNTPKFAESCTVFDWKILRHELELLLLVKVPIKHWIQEIPIGNFVKLTFTNSKGVHSFDTQIQSLKSKNISYDLYLTQPQNYQKIERREFFRLPVNITTTFRLLKFKNVDLSFNQKEGKGLVSDISAGGLLFQSNLALPCETVLEFTFLLPQEGIVLVTGQVVRNCQKENNTFYGIQFINIDSETSGRISRFVYNHEQRLQTTGQ